IGCPSGIMQPHPETEGVSDLRFIQPCSPVTAKSVPTGDGWVHEVKFDGYRVQAHKLGSRVVLLSRNGHDFTERFPSIAQLAARAAGQGRSARRRGRGQPCRRASKLCLTARALDPAGHCPIWAFDLLALNGRDLRLHPLMKRQALLQALLERFGCPTVSLSE